MFTIEGDYIIYDQRRIARFLPTLTLPDRRDAEEALEAHETDLSDGEVANVTEIEQDRITEKLRKLADISGGLLSWAEIEEAIESKED